MLSVESVGMAQRFMALLGHREDASLAVMCDGLCTPRHAGPHRASVSWMSALLGWAMGAIPVSRRQGA